MAGLAGFWITVVLLLSGLTISVSVIGTVVGSSLRISAGNSSIDVSLEQLREAHAALAALFA